MYICCTKLCLYANKLEFYSRKKNSIVFFNQKQAKIGQFKASKGPFSGCSGYHGNGTLIKNFHAKFYERVSNNHYIPNFSKIGEVACPPLF
jgi:hypothetical protein